LSLPQVRLVGRFRLGRRHPAPGIRGLDGRDRGDGILPGLPALQVQHPPVVPPDLNAGAQGRDAPLAFLLEAEFTDANILYIVEVTAIFNYNVRLATATGLFPNTAYHALGRVTHKEG
jgi:hypothetical protein